MKVYRFSIVLISVTLLSLLYVHQQVQLVKISYQIESNEKEFVRLLDQNKSLLYNITKLKSPVYLEKKFLATKKEYGIPQQWQVVEVAAPKIGREPVKLAKKKGRLAVAFTKIFGKPREVFANTIK